MIKILNSKYILHFILLFILAFNFNETSGIQNPEDTTSGYSLKQINNIWWLCTPKGEPFFSSGVCCVHTGLSFDEYKTNNPGYAAWQHFKSPIDWAGDTIDSLKAWNFTTIGGWSSLEHFLKSPKMNMPFIPMLAMGMEAGAPWLDMWDSTIVKRIEEIAKRTILKVKDSPYLLGYYTDNEMGWWNAALWNMTFNNNASSIARIKMIDLVTDYYKNNWDSLLADFDPEGAESFDGLYKKGNLFLRPGSRGIFVINKFVEMMAERYYSMTREIIRKYDKRSLILGDRYQSFYYPAVARATSKYIDILSTNLNAHWNDGTFLRFYLSTLFELSGKPIAIGEYYMAANENRSGNKNSTANFPTVQTQEQRVKGFLTTAKILAQTPYVVMADWFQFHDEPTHGRDDGENYNMGLVDIYGKPYEELVYAAGNFDWNKEKLNSLLILPDASGGIPPAPGENIINVTLKETLRNWDRMHGFVKPVSAAPLADMYICWNPDTVYVAIYGIDVYEKELYRDKIVPEEDRMELVLRFDKNHPEIRMRLSSDKKPSWNDKDVDVFNSYEMFIPSYNISVVRIPAKIFGKSKLSEGDQIKFSAQLNGFARGSKINWEIDYPLITDVKDLGKN